MTSRPARFPWTGRTFAISKLDDLRTSMGVVLQEPFFFATTIRENLLYARPDATEEQMIAAAKTANAHYFVSRLPHGYDTVLSERGNNLVAGGAAVARNRARHPRRPADPYSG